MGEIGILGPLQFGNQSYVVIRFKFTDANQTSTCTDQSQAQVGATTKYAYFFGIIQGSNNIAGDHAYKEWYAALLVSKKGAMLTCGVVDNQNCRVKTCTLP